MYGKPWLSKIPIIEKGLRETNKKILITEKNEVI